jgi:hypothetical protein
MVCNACWESAGLCHVLYPNKAAGWKPQKPTTKYWIKENNGMEMQLYGLATLWICGLTVLIVASIFKCLASA